MTINSRVLIDASNLHHGGGVQVAASFIDEVGRLSADHDLVSRFPWLATVDIWASPSVVSNLSLGLGPRIQERTTRWSRPWSYLRLHPKHAAIFTIFGPDYSIRRASSRLVGFADVTSIYERPKTLAPQRPIKRLKGGLRASMSRTTVRRADLVVVEAHHVKRQLMVRWSIPEQRIKVVPNTVSGVFRRPRPKRVLSLPGAPPRLLYVARAYEHKNLDFLGRVGDAMAHQYGITPTFVLTLRPDEWQRLSAQTRAYAVNLGPTRVNDLPDLYEACDAAIFPSLLECFSATPLEAIQTNTTLFASDRDFVRDIVKDACFYFDPFDPNDAARVVVENLRDIEARAQRSAAGKLLMRSLPSAADRAVAYLNLIDQALTAQTKRLT